MNQTVVRAGSVKRCGPREDGRQEGANEGVAAATDGLVDLAAAPCKANKA